MFNYDQTLISQVSVHQVGNKNNDENITISKTPLNIDDFVLEELLRKYFLNNFTTPELYSFTSSSDDFKLNDVYNFARQIFNDPQSFHIQTINLAKHLYESSNHPNIKPGDFYIALFSNVRLHNEITDVVGLFKSETKDTFLKLMQAKDNFEMQHEEGIDIKKLDKGCLIFNTNEEEGYKVCIIDKANKGGEALFWKDQFLNLKPLADDFHHTKNFMSFTKSFVADKLHEEFEVSKAEKVSFLNRSMDYFKHKENFDEQEFATEVFHDENVIKSFLKYKDDFQQEKDIALEGEFGISAPAVKKQERVFKSVLKLDKNFHIYIHGDKQLIEKGTEPDGRKFYKIYYTEEQ
ncbi:MAG: nucleoid-associated protein [Bacteroidia bacterium]